MVGFTELHGSAALTLGFPRFRFGASGSAPVKKKFSHGPWARGPGVNPQRRSFEVHMKKSPSLSAAASSHGTPGAATGRAGKTGKRQRADEPDDFVSKAAKPKPVRKLQRASACLRCQEEPGGTKKWYFAKVNTDGSSTPLDNKCFACYDCYLIAWTHRGTWEEVCKLCQEEPRTDAAFGLCVEIRQGNQTRDFFQCEIVKASTLRITAERSLIGLDHSQFKNIFNHRPEELGFRTQTLHTVNNDSYRGVLVCDPNCQGTKYTVARDIEVRHDIFKLSQDRHLYEEQAEQTVKFEEEKLQKDENLMTKVRTCAVSFDDIWAAVKRKNTSGDDEGEDEEHDEEEELASGDDSDLVGIIPTAVLNSEAVASGSGMVSSFEATLSRKPMTVEGSISAGAQAQNSQIHGMTVGTSPRDKKATMTPQEGMNEG